MLTTTTPCCLFASLTRSLKAHEVLQQYDFSVTRVNFKSSFLLFTTVVLSADEIPLLLCVVLWRPKKCHRNIIILHVLANILANSINFVKVAVKLSCFVGCAGNMSDNEATEAVSYELEIAVYASISNHSI